MRVYLASPDNQLQAQAASGSPVLLSFAICGEQPWMQKGYAASFSRLLLDSGAYSVHTKSVTVDLVEYSDWVAQFKHVDAVAGLDDIGGDWRKSLKAYEQGIGFPTIHDTDPDHLIDELIPISRERGNWLGVGICPNPTRTGREDWLRRTLERVPKDIHVHGFALRTYSHVTRMDSFDSTSWWRCAMRIRKEMGTWLTFAEALELSIKQIQRTARMRDQVDETSKQQRLNL